MSDRSALHVRWIEPSEIADEEAIIDTVGHKDFGPYVALNARFDIVEHHHLTKCPCGRTIAAAEQIRGYIYAEWRRPAEGGGLDITPRAFAVCTECSPTPEQLVALCERDMPEIDMLNIVGMQELVDQLDREHDRPKH
jgi:hypothetical protein